MYEEFYGLKVTPFDVQPDPRFAYPSAEHQIAIAKMRYAADQKRGLAVLTGPIGAGKTTVANQLLTVFDEDPAKTVGFLPSSSVRTPAAFLRLVLGAFDQKQSRTEADNRFRLEQFLLEEFRQGRHPILLLDEGQDISADNIDTISSLTNFQTAKSKLITVVMLAQDNLPNKLERKDAFRSRIAVIGHLDPLSYEETVKMIDHRIRTAGGKGVEDYFDEPALRAVYDTTQGIPRDICILGDAAFVNGYVRNQRHMDEAIIELTVSEMGREKQWPVQLGRHVSPTPKIAVPASPEVPPEATAAASPLPSPETKPRTKSKPKSKAASSPSSLSSLSSPAAVLGGTPATTGTTPRRTRGVA